ncbi:MAG TPA: hypothetical protein VH113_00140 [Gemmatimonadales bacterium]|nr:hypothetical protein [Gemmatimonadales bacterium]
MTDRELQDWLIEEIRRKPDWGTFAADLTFVRRHSASSSGATWEVEAATGSDTWSRARHHAFEAAVRQAQQAFDLID